MASIMVSIVVSRSPELVEGTVRKVPTAMEEQFSK
jgi:hypothetical protein